MEYKKPLSELLKETQLSSDPDWQAGEAAVEKGDYDTALASFRTVMEKDELAYIHEKIIETLEKAGRTEEAEAEKEIFMQYLASREKQ
jgi:lipopolysaccharide biosynthesis regulator YciM